jgi:hypothetical protein
MSEGKQSIGTEKEPLGQATIATIVGLVGNFRGVPDELLSDLEQFLSAWGNPTESYKEPRQAYIEVRPYKITELAAIEGAPSRGRIYQILNELGIPLEQSRCANGALAPEVVEKILKYRKGPVASRNPRGRSKATAPETQNPK